MNIKPLRDKIIVKPEARFKSALYIADSSPETSGHVIAAGDEAIRQGLKVHFGTVAKDQKDEYLKFEPIKIGEDKCLKMSWQDICFVEDV